MIDRRTLIALTATSPLAIRNLRLDEPDPRIDPLITGGASILGISPDGSTLVGRQAREQISFLEIDTGEIISKTDPIPEVSLIDESSISWSPDGSRIAFSLEAWLMFRDSDIYVADVQSGELTNVTPEGHEKESDSLFEAPDVQIDLYPKWLDDNTLLFARHEGVASEVNEAQTTFVSLTLEDGEISTWSDLSDAGIRYVNGPIVSLPNDTLVFAGDDWDNQFHLYVTDSAGEIQKIDTGELGGFQLVDANETHAIVADGAFSGGFWYVTLDSSESVELLWRRFDPPEGMQPMSNPALGIEPHSLVAVLRTRRDAAALYQFDDSGARQLAELTGEVDALTCHWANDQVLVTGRRDSWLVPSF